MWETIERLLKERDMNMTKLSEQTGITKGRLSHLKKGDTEYLSWPNMIKIADALDISLDEFR